MKRREFMSLVGGAVATWPLAVQAQQQSIPVIGFLHSGSPGPNLRRVAGLRRGLEESGFLEGKNVAIEFRWAEGHDERLAEMAADLVQRRVALIATLSSTVAAVAAKKATSNIPIYFLIADPPEELGLVQSLNRPGGNATGIVTLAAEVAAKRFSLLRAVAPNAPGLAVLIKPSHPSAKPVAASVRATAATLSVQVEILEANSDREIVAALTAIKPGVPVMVGTDPLFFARRAELIALTAKRSIPAIYDSREFAEAGGLMSYGPNHVSLWRQAGGYIARVLKGENPAQLPVVQAERFEMIMNLKTAKALGLDLAPTLLALADEVIE